jgi:hypothetical protein
MGNISMSEWLNIDPPAEWEEIETGKNSVAFQHQEAEVELRILRIVRPGFDEEGYRISYIARCIALQSNSWIDLFETDDKADIECRIQQTLDRLSHRWGESDRRGTVVNVIAEIAMSSH